MVERGIIFPEHVAETRKVDSSDPTKTTTRVRDKGFFFLKKIMKTDKDK